MRESLKEKIYSQGYPNAEAAPIVSIEDFFEGNNDEGSIGCNLLEHPGIDTFYKVFLDIREKTNVQNVFVEIMEIEDNEDYWAFSERVYILTSADISTVEGWVEQLQPTEIDEGYAFGKPPLAPDLKEGYKVISIWWD